MASAEVIPIEDRLTKILTPLAGLLTAAGGLAGVTGVLTPVIRGSEGPAFVSFVLLLFGFFTLVYVRLFEWEPDDVRARRSLIGLSVLFFTISLLSVAWVYIQAIGRDHRPAISVSVTAGQRTKVTGTVTSSSMAANERLAVDIRVGADPATAAVMLNQVTGPDSTGTGTITLDASVDVAPNSVILVEAWLPDRSDAAPDCSLTDTDAPAGTPAPGATPGVVDKIKAFIPQRQPFVSCVYVLPPAFQSAGPKVTISSDSEKRTVSVTVASPVDANEAVLLRVWDRAQANKLLYSSLVYPGADGEASGSASVSIGSAAADICAVAVQGLPITIAGSVLGVATCSAAGSLHQGWAEIVIGPAPTAQPTKAPK